MVNPEAGRHLQQQPPAERVGIQGDQRLGVAAAAADVFGRQWQQPPVVGRKQQAAIGRFEQRFAGKLPYLAIVQSDQMLHGTGQWKLGERQEKKNCKGESGTRF